MNKTIITCAACLIAVFSSFMFVYAHTLQRSADDIVKIHAKDKSALEQRYDDCVANAFVSEIQDCNKIKDFKSNQ